jgi:hypothetical protein
MSDLINNYSDAIRQRLSFDRTTAERLAEETQDHLYETMASAGDDASDDAVRRAIRRFGSPEDIAMAYTRETFPARLRSTWASGVLLCAIVALTMLLRRSLQLLPDFTGMPELHVVFFADAVAFRLAIILGLLAWAASMHTAAYRHSAIIVKTLVAAAIALMVSISASLILTACALSSHGWSMTTVVPFVPSLLACLLLAKTWPKICVLKGYASLIGPSEMAV